MIGIPELLMFAGTTALGGEILSNPHTWLTDIKDWVTALGPTALVVVGGIVTWFLKSKSDELRAIEEKLRDGRRQNYQVILDPFVKIFASHNNTGLQEEATKTIVSVDYRKAAFELMFIGSDEVIRAFNHS